MVIQACDAAMHTRADLIDGGEKSDEYFQVMRALIELEPDSQAIIQQILDEPLTVQSLSLISNLG